MQSRRRLSFLRLRREQIEKAHPARRCGFALLQFPADCLCGVFILFVRWPPGITDFLLAAASILVLQNQNGRNLLLTLLVVLVFLSNRGLDAALYVWFFHRFFCRLGRF